MFTRRYFDVLVVDDEPDILQLTLRSLRGLQFEGAHLRLQSFTSKGAALAFMQNLADPTEIAVALVDLVIESDTAGLEFCDHIRNGMRNDVTQLIIRSGQVGRAPERVVLETYDVNGYVDKATATQDLLVSRVFSALRQYDWAISSLLQYRFFNTLLPGFRSRGDIYEAVKRYINHVLKRGDGLVANLCLFVDDSSLPFGIYVEPEQVKGGLERLRRIPGRSLSPGGDNYRIHEVQGGFEIMLSLGQQASGLMPAVSMIARVSAKPSEFKITMWERMLFTVRRFLMIADFVTSRELGKAKGGS